MGMCASADCTGDEAEDDISGNHPKEPLVVDESDLKLRSTSSLRVVAPSPNRLFNELAQVGPNDLPGAGPV